MLFFPEITGKTLSLTWSKKNNSYRAKGQRPKPKPSRTVAARVESLSLSPSRLNSHSEKVYLYHSNSLLLADVRLFPLTIFHLIDIHLDSQHLRPNVICIHIINKSLMAIIVSNTFKSGLVDLRDRSITFIK